MEQAKGAHAEEPERRRGEPDPASKPGPAPSSGLLPDITEDEGVDPYDDRHYLEQRPPHHA